MRKVIAALVIILFFIEFGAMVSADSDSLKVVLFVGTEGDGHSYDIGENIPVKVLVYDKGVLTDSDEPPLVIMNLALENTREISIAKTKTGTYDGSFTLQESDLIQESWFDIDATATLGKDNTTDPVFDSDRAMGFVCTVNKEINDLKVNIEFENLDEPPYKVKPGDIIDIRITVEENGKLIDPDSFDLTANDSSISYTNPENGVFEATYTVGASITEDTEIMIQAEAENDDVKETAYMRIDVDFFIVWYHKISITDSYSNFDLYVADMDGKIVSGAQVDIDYHGFRDDGSLSDITDISGKSSFTINYDSANTIWIDGNIEFQGLIQNFEGSIMVSVYKEEPDPEEKFQVICQIDRNAVSPGKTAFVDYMAYENGDPLRNKEIFYYLYTSYEAIADGSITTKFDGKFTLVVRVPTYTWLINTDFESAFDPEIDSWHTDSDDGLDYQEDFDHLFVDFESEYNEPDKNIEIEVEEFSLGGNAVISSTRPYSEDLYGFAFIIPGKYEPENYGKVSDLDWISWSNQEVFSYSFYLFLNEEDEIRKTHFVLPEFLPKEETYTVVVIYKYEQFGPPWNYVHVTPTEEDIIDNKPDDGTSSISGPEGFIVPLVLLFIIVLIIIAIGIKLIRRKKQD